MSSTNREGKKAERSSQYQLPSFAHIFMPQLHSTILPIPIAFTQNSWKLAPKMIMLTNSHGRVWKGKVEVGGDGQFYLTRGWQEFVSSYTLVRGNFVIFKPLDAFNFCVKVFDTTDTLIEKDSAAAETPPADEFENSTGSDGVSETEKFVFSKILRTRTKHTLNMPRIMIKDFECELPQVVMMHEHDNRGHTLVSKVHQRKDGVCISGKKLIAFWKKTKAEIGDKLKFEVILQGRKIKEIRLKITPKEANTRRKLPEDYCRYS